MEVNLGQPDPAPDALQRSRRLSSFIRLEIQKAGGAIGFDRYMYLALYEPTLGYYTGSSPIFGLGGETEDTFVFHAGTASDQAHGVSRVVTHGGRVLTVVGSGDSLAQARSRAYDRVRQISFQGSFYRTDIAGLETGDRVWSPGPAAAGRE